MEKIYVDRKNVRSEQEVKEAINNVAMKDKEHLKKWLKESGRRFLIFNAEHLVDALPFPIGVEWFQMILYHYREYRRGLFTGEVKREPNPITGEVCEVNEMHDEVLSVHEIDGAIRELAKQMRRVNPDYVI